MPYLDTITSILNDVKGWFFALIGIVTLVVVVKNAFAYQAGDSAEKQDALRSIKKAIIMGGGIFILSWFATYVITKMSSVS
ncbi:MAG: hypothetical protein M1479_08755 [Actinobacteria bacterium]|nr:hypothetical protein [Actinomycetota bacterium]MCL5772346.1 hypothetical protein [Actinomycetota bacterium]